MRRLRALASLALAALAALALASSACTTPSFGDGHLQCAASTRACPAGFYCAADSHCWRPGSGPPPPDLSTSAPSDLATVDLAFADLAPTPSRCALGNFKLCDGFEAGAIDATLWSVHTANGTVTLDDTFAFRGHSSIKLHHDAVTVSTGGQAEALLHETTTFPITGTIYARGWFFLPAAPPVAVAQLINVNDSTGAGLGFVDDTGHPGINDYASPPAYTASGNEMVPRGVWTCLQLQVQQSGATGSVQIFMDGNPVDVSLTAGATPTIAQLDFSLYYYMPPMLPAEDVWLDEVIVDDKPVSCAD